MGGGGPAKAAQPTVTPFVDPAGPKNPIPNWFAGSGATGGNSGGGSFTPDFSKSQTAFSMGNPTAAGNTGIVPPQQAPAQQAPAQQAYQPPAQNYQPQPAVQPPMNYPATSTPVAAAQNYAPPQDARPMMPFSIPTWNNQKPWWAEGFGKWGGGPAANWDWMSGLRDMMQGVNQPPPVYTNYTDTTPEHSPQPVQPMNGLLNLFGG